MKVLLAYGYANTNGVTAHPRAMVDAGSWKRIPKFIAINPDKNNLACVGEISPVVSGLAYVLSTCLSISLSARSLITHPADLAPIAPAVKRPIVYGHGTYPGAPNMIPQRDGTNRRCVPI